MCTEERVTLVKSCEHEASVCQICLDKVSCCPVCRAQLSAPKKRSRQEAALDDEVAVLELRLSVTTEDTERWEEILYRIIERHERSGRLSTARERLLQRVMDTLDELEAERQELKAQLEAAGVNRTTTRRREGEVVEIN